MFTGIIECTGTIKEVIPNRTNLSFIVQSAISSTLKVDQSLSHNGVCLTVEEVNENSHRVTAIDETLQKTQLGQLRIGDLVNLERCLKMGDRLDGHIVQGHVDTTAICTTTENKDGSWLYQFQIEASFAHLIIEKGSISVNGISLTCFGVGKDCFKVAIIPYTYYHTNIKQIVEGSLVNIEFDMVGKYVVRKIELNSEG